MLKRCKLFSLVALIFAGSLFADCGPSYGGNCCPGISDCGPGFGGDCCNNLGWLSGRWQFDVEFLYFLPTFDDTYFVIQNGISSPGVPAGTRLHNDFDFRPGFRVGASMSLCGCCDGELEAYYTRLSHNRTRTVSSGFLFATMGSPDTISTFQNYVGFARSEADFLYQRVDSFFGNQLWCNSCMDLVGQFGLEWAYVRLREQIEYNTINDEDENVFGLVDRFSKNWGIGPQFGLKYDYLICETSCFLPGALSLAAHTTGSLLVSKTRSSTTESLTGALAVDVSDESTWRIVPALHARIGLNYATILSCFGCCVEVGYEFSSYIRALAHQVYLDSTAESLVATNYHNFDVQGLYIAVDVNF